MLEIDHSFVINARTGSKRKGSDHWSIVSKVLVEDVKTVGSAARKVGIGKGNIVEENASPRSTGQTAELYSLRSRQTAFRAFRHAFRM